MKYPKFVVVGHPNKGKSSIVSTLTLNDTIAISNTPGTTKLSRNFFLQKGDRVYYELIDTPGFQRPRKLLKWLKEHGDVGAIKRPKLIEKFLKEHCLDDEFKDECELLKPIMQGGAIIYVVDASKPYSDEYEVEMEILRYTSKPSLAILNYIGEEDYTKEWDAVLGQYFRVVKSFDPFNSNISEHIDLLEALSHVDNSNSKEIKEAIKVLKEYNKELKSKIAFSIATYIKDSLNYTIVKKLNIFNKDEDALKKEFKENIVNKERKLFDNIKSILNFKQSEFTLKSKELEYDIFSEKSQEIFGLKKEKLVLITTLSSAAVGGAIDLAVGGHSFFLGSIIGAGVGFASAIYGYDEISKIKFIGSESVQIGPVEDPNFGFVLLNRAITYANALLNTTHANRKAVEIELNSDDTKLKTLKKLNKLHKKFRENKESEKDLTHYIEIIESLLKE